MQISCPKISIVIPVYNAAAKIERCLNSILGQSMRDFEVICVDDKSCDDTIATIKRLAETDSRISLLCNEENMGTLMSRKRGVLASTGDYVISCDGDDWFEPDALQIAYNAIIDRKVDVLLYGARPVASVDDVDSVKLKVWEAKLKAHPERVVGEHAYTELHPMYFTWNRIVKSDIMKEAYGNMDDVYHMTVGEDNYACWMIHYFASSFETIPDILYNWDFGEGSSTRAKKSIDSFAKFCRGSYLLVDSLSRFFAARNEDLLLERISRNGSFYVKDRSTSWATAVSKEDSVEAFHELCQWYGEEKILPTIHDICNNSIQNLKCKDASVSKLQEENQRLKKDITKLKTKNKSLRNSTSMKIGLLLTFIPRKLKKLFP